MKKDCNIVKDLLPLYIEKMVSEETASFIEEHLKNCEDCKKYYESLKIPKDDYKINEETQDDIKLLKNVKSKLRKNKIGTILLSIVLIFTAIFGYISIRPVFINAVIDYGESELYTKSDMDKAIYQIKKHFSQMDGCTLYKIEYISDEKSMMELEYVNDLAPDGVVYTECIVFRSEFRSPITGGGAWNPNSMYYWSWYLARTNLGGWQLVSWGYA